MEKLIKLEALQQVMSGGKDDLQLEDKLPKLLNGAIAVMPEKGRAVDMYFDGKENYLVTEEGITKYWKSTDEDGNPITDRKNLTKEEFLDWVFKQPEKTQRQIYKNISNYINTETPKERGEVEFPKSDYLFGY